MLLALIEAKRRRLGAVKVGSIYLYTKTVEFSNYKRVSCSSSSLSKTIVSSP